MYVQTSRLKITAPFPVSGSKLPVARAIWWPFVFNKGSLAMFKYSFLASVFFIALFCAVSSSELRAQARTDEIEAGIKSSQELQAGYKTNQYADVVSGLNALPERVQREEAQAKPGAVQVRESLAAGMNETVWGSLGYAIDLIKSADHESGFKASDHPELLAELDPFQQAVVSKATSLRMANTIRGHIIQQDKDINILNHTGGLGKAAACLASLVDFSIFFTIFFAIRIRSTPVSLLLIVALMFCYGAIFLPDPLHSYAILAHASFGLYLHRLIAFWKQRPLFMGCLNLDFFYKKTAISPVSWKWSDRVLSLLNCKVRTLDKIAFCFLAFLVIWPPIVVGHLIVWSVYLFGFAVPLLLLEAAARFIFSLYKSGSIHKNLYVARLKTKEKMEGELLPWIANGFHPQEKDQEDTSDNQNC